MRQGKLEDRELVSALVDGQLRGDEFARVVGLLADSGEALTTWHTYHVVGDVLRCADLADCRKDHAFVARFRGHLASQVSAPHSIDDFSKVVGPDPARLPGLTGLTQKSARRHSANDAVRRWRLLAGVASMVAVVAVALNISSGDTSLGRSAVVSGVPVGATFSTTTLPQPGSLGNHEPPVMLRDARLDELLAAHKQFGGTSALQMPAGFLRSATFESAGR